AWILFMLAGFIVAIASFWRKRFSDWRLFRTLHLCGIIYIGILALLGKYCPLTILENTLKAKYAPESMYPGSFIVHYIERLVYPDINPLIIVISTVFIAFFTLIAFIINRPKK
ncbi:MAG: DUF2784 domain-containing protein, partial [Elusimicrobiales bacterium]|nr:DUF2784 domain-containing protein [Elusimicrobiales bacterium]